MLLLHQFVPPVTAPVRARSGDVDGVKAVRLNMESDEAYMSSPTLSPNSLATSLIDNLIHLVTGDKRGIQEEEDVDSGKDSSNITDSKSEDGSLQDSSDLDEVSNDGEVEQGTAADISFIENWKMERQFDKAIEGLKKLKGEPVTLKYCEDTVSDNETFVISPFSENQTYTVLKEGFLSTDSNNSFLKKTTLSKIYICLNSISNLI